MSFRDGLAKLGDAYRRHGTGAAARVLRATLARKSDRLYLFGLERKEPVPEPRPPGPAHVLRFADRNDVDRGCAEGLWSHALVEAAATGDRCLMHWDGPTLVGYVWVARSPLAVLTRGLHLNLPDDVAYVYRSYTAPAYRGAGFQALRTLELLRRLQPEGKRRLLRYVSWTNFASIRAGRKCGYERVGRVDLSWKGGRLRFALTIRDDYWSDLRRA